MLHDTIRYPALIVEKKPRKYTIVDIVWSPSDYVTLSRMPAQLQYVDGRIFDSEGQVFSYSGSAGWPRFGETSKFICELLIIPSFFVKMLAYIAYYGPNVRTVESIDLASYKQEILTRYPRELKPEERMELTSLFNRANTFEEVIKAYDWWRLHGGKRDEDGHPLEDNGA
jgi:hypothetical protein